MHALALMLALAPLVAMHDRSEGRARFDLDGTGRLDIAITLSELDMPELCDLDLANGALREERLRALDACLGRNVPLLLRVRDDGGASPEPCPVLVENVDASNGTVAVSAVALCPRFPERLVLDWGLFASTPLDHVAVATFSQPHAAPKLVMLSKRSSKLVVDVARPLWPKLVAGALLLAAMVGITGVLVRRRRR